MPFKKGDERNVIGKFASHPGRENGRYKHGRCGEADYGSTQQLWRRYKMTPEQYNCLLESQGNSCALCFKVRVKERRMPVDHDHGCCSGKVSCGKCVRGILCQQCNIRLGALEATLAESALIAYPNTWTARAMIYLNSYAPAPAMFGGKDMRAAVDAVEKDLAQLGKDLAEGKVPDLIVRRTSRFDQEY